MHMRGHQELNFSSMLSEQVVEFSAHAWATARQRKLRRQPKHLQSAAAGVETGGGAQLAAQRPDVALPVATVAADADLKIDEL